MIFVIKLIIAAFIVRFHVNSYRLGANNIVTKLNQITDPVVLPFKPLFKKQRYDFSSIIVAVIISILGGILFIHLDNSIVINGGGISATTQTLLGIKLGIIVLFLNTWIDTIFYTMLLTVIGSWLQTDPRQPVMQVALSCSQWLLAPIRSVIPSVGGLDFSPIIVLLLLNLARRILLYLL